MENLRKDKNRKCHKCNERNKNIQLVYNNYYCDKCLIIVKKQANKELDKILKHL